MSLGTRALDLDPDPDPALARRSGPLAHHRAHRSAHRRLTDRPDLVPQGAPPSESLLAIGEMPFGERYLEALLARASRAPRSRSRLARCAGPEQDALPEAPMSDCIFCQIAAGTTKAEIVHETPEAIAFLDKFPAARGHVVVIPRAHAVSLPELDDAAVGGLFRAVKDAMRKVTSALAPAGMNVGWNHGRAAGQVVMHLHVHLLPRFAEGGRGIQVMGEGTGRVSFAELGETLRRA